MKYLHGMDGSQELQKNVSDNERLITGIGGALLGLSGIRHGGLGGLLGLAVGGALVARAVTGHCPVYQRMGMDDRERRLAERHGWQQAAVSRETITVNRPREQLYRFWREQSNLAKVMSHVERVELLDSRRSHWVIALPLGKTLEWDAEITEDQPNERIAWRADQSADLRNAGWVEFRDAPGGRGTEITVQLAYEPPAGELGHAVAKLWPTSPGALLERDLQQLKQRFESGELGQPLTPPAAPAPGSPLQRH
jgi:uncharacterized membrane protein